LVIVPGKGKSHCNTYNKQKKWKDQICRRAAVPIGVTQRTINISPATRGVNNYHESNGKPTKGIKSK
jgi:hypothetical protein